MTTKKPSERIKEITKDIWKSEQNSSLPYSTLNTTHYVDAILKYLDEEADRLNCIEEALLEIAREMDRNPETQEDFYKSIGAILGK
jgi:hypothetical protein